MLDEDLAELYEVETKQLKRQVRRNIDRFPEEDILCELTKDELENLRSQLAPQVGAGHATCQWLFCITQYLIGQVRRKSQDLILQFAKIRI